VTALLVALLGAGGPGAPAVVIITTPRGEAVVPVVLERGMAALAAPSLAGPLGLATRFDGATAIVSLGDLEFRFELGSPFATAGGTVYSVVTSPYLARDTLFVPLPWLSDAVPRAAGGRYRWLAAAARFEELPPPPVLPPPHPLTGLRREYTVVVDPGHGGRDPGNPGIYLPAGQTEKHVTLAIGRQLRAELVRRGVQVRLTRTTDTLIDLGDRGAACRATCDLFVSIHVNAMPRGPRQRVPNGVETYFLSDAKTEDQRRVARMENDAIRFETTSHRDQGDLAFIIRDLQQNEYLRESARLADLVQAHLATAHPGQNRGVQQAGFVVLGTAGRPAILVEAGFATHRGDGTFLGSALGQRKLAQALADGIVAYLLEYERKSGLPAGAGR
jgi:N-acetylmuramoyl-L-alanine amidase